MRVLSLFDGMACGMLAFQDAGIRVERYVAFEIDKYAVKTSSYNFPMIEHHGDVFQADFTKYYGFDFLVGGSPCTYWSIAQKNNRETEASGMGWELFNQYVRALHEAKPRFFIYENNKSMSKAIKQSITETFGFEPICINSALVSAQNRQRLYWVGKRNDDGTYNQVHVEHPKDRGILLRDVLDGATPINVADIDKSYGLKANYHKSACANFLNGGGHYPQTGVAEPVNTTTDGKAQCIRATCYKDGARNIVGNHVDRRTGVAEPVRIPEYGVAQKARCLTASYANKGVGEGSLATEAFPENPNKQVRDYVAESVRVGALPRPNGELSTSQAFRVYSTNGETVNITAGGGGADGKTGLYAIPCCNMIVKEATKKGYAEIMPMDCVDMTQPNSMTRRGRNMADKSNCCMTSCQYYQYCGVLAYATPCEWDEEGNVIKAVSVSDGKTYPVYEVKNGFIIIKGRQYSIKLVDGYYIIRKLTVSECKRLQTVPEWYEFPVSDTQAYKMLGNGWTVQIISHLIGSVLCHESHTDNT